MDSSNLVFEGDLILTYSSGWYEIVLDTSFYFTNTENIVITFDYNSGSDISATPDFKSKEASSYRNISYRSDFSNPNITNPPTGNTWDYIPNLRLLFNYDVLNDIEIPTITTASVSSITDSSAVS